ncbi:Exodeoxyribonuclease V [Lentibacillus sp. JNUCC-1]|uniref:SF1B family DNA helicase RecD2 n=1 Tax=Lentibacillus sp. JNUCC-1 TaxID=2654513 RepID=UPI0012E8B7FA|nr:ATP-dependent RecD-like DNA helicase [Lentibacillus sp. JNUCC-1]MUV39541.1 Exodeoxyribonuclease V [Lentibacillus sp. JNUCC-1]
MDVGERSDQGYIKGELLHTIFMNDSNQFSIVKLKIHETNESYPDKEIVAKGYLPRLNEGTLYYFYGALEQHAKFGMQYNVTSYRTFIPDTKTGLVAYLSSDLFHGIGKRTAEKIVDALGEQAITAIMNDRNSLNNVPGMKTDQADKLFSALQENQGFEHIAVSLATYGIGMKMAQKIYKHYKDTAMEVLTDDPYQYVYDIEGFGFQTADAIARKNGLSATHPNRIGAGCIYVLQEHVQSGHVYLPMDICVREIKKLLTTPELTEDMIIDVLKDLNTKKTVIVQQGNVYLPSLYYAEDGFAANVKRLQEQQIETDTTMAELLKITGEVEDEEILSYGEDQFEAIQKALHSKIMILTGGPGTGKTTVIKGILHAYANIHNLSLDRDDYDRKADYPFVLTAPTGRAAKRLNESTGLRAVTIHRLLGWDGQDSFEKDDHEQLDGQFLIVDEFSMVDIWLANQLFKAIPDNMQVLLVGDEDQLPSVGPGQVLSDLLKSGLIPSVQLNEVYRQKEGSKIIKLAHQIKNDTCTEADLHNDYDFSFIPCHGPQIIDVLTGVFKKAIEKGIEISDIQVLAPMYRTQAGIHTINRHLQALINPKTRQKREIRVYDVAYRVGDRMIQLVNQPEDGVYNGDIGEIVAIFREEENTENEEQVVLSFDGKEVVYSKKDYGNIMHAYCISIHKAQGSEFPIVVLPVVHGYSRMLRKNLLYTAITRSKQSLILTGEKPAFLKGIATPDTNRRYTTLINQLTNRLNTEKQDETTEDIDDNHEEEEISPYDFM